MIDMPLRPLISIILRSLYEMVLVLSFRLLEVECINEKWRVRVLVITHFIQMKMMMSYLMVDTPQTIISIHGKDIFWNEIQLGPKTSILERFGQCITWKYQKLLIKSEKWKTRMTLIENDSNENVTQLLCQRLDNLAQIWLHQNEDLTIMRSIHHHLTITKWMTLTHQSMEWELFLVSIRMRLIILITEIQVLRSKNEWRNIGTEILILMEIE